MGRTSAWHSTRIRPGPTTRIGPGPDQARPGGSGAGVGVVEGVVEADVVGRRAGGDGRPVEVVDGVLEGVDLVVVEEVAGGEAGRRGNEVMVGRAGKGAVRLACAQRKGEGGLCLQGDEGVRLRQAGEDCKHLLNIVIGKERATSVGKAAHRSGWTGTISSVTLRYLQ
jgi:hypothetical protein